jgi:LacI family transcriptional regulator
MKRKATTNDIARMLGLSRTTVSKALNGHPTVPPATRQRVLDMAAQLHYKHYRPADQANRAELRDAAGAAMRTIACLIRSSLARSGSKGYWVDVLQGIEESTRRRGWNMVLHFVHQEDLDSLRLPRSLTEAHVDGVIMAGITRLAYARAVAELGLPAVLIDHDSAARAEDALFDTVLMESEQSVCDLTARLIALGHRRIGFIGDIADCLSFRERWNGFRRAMMDAGLSVDPACCAVAPKPGHYYDGAEIAEALAAMPALPTAFVCANDVVAVRTIQTLGRMGLTVPEDLSVTGFDAIETDTDPLPDGLQLMSVRIDAVRVGSRAFEQLALRMAQPDRPIEHIRLATVPVAGTSAAPPKA